jgi:hypothetical protein
VSAVKHSVVVVAHPRPGNFVPALAEAAVSVLAETGYEAMLHDLYAERFNPVLDPAEMFTTRPADEGADPLTTRTCVPAQAAPSHRAQHGGATLEQREAWLAQARGLLGHGHRATALGGQPVGRS